MAKTRLNEDQTDVVYELAGISADANQCSRYFIRSDTKGVKKNISQMIAKLQKIKDKL